MTPCLSDVGCATSEEVKAFYKANPKLQFMFVDHYFDFNDFEILFDSYTNTVNYVSVDPAYLSSVDLFVRKLLLDG